jgi:hypothetical protein
MLLHSANWSHLGSVNVLRRRQKVHTRQRSIELLEKRRLIYSELCRLSQNHRRPTIKLVDSGALIWERKNWGRH